jgi:hypothetical protein
VIDNARNRAPFQFEEPISYQNRTNFSRGLGALRDMAQTLSQANSPSNILFINSSCSWEPNLLGQYVLRLRELSQEVVFATDSYQPEWHIQSFFMWISKDVCDLALSVLAKNLLLRTGNSSEMLFSEAKSNSLNNSLKLTSKYPYCFQRYDF